jgi:predicted transcriptional regulator
MAAPKLSRLELRIMDAIWTLGSCSVREVQESFAEESRPAYTTVHTIVTRLEAKKAVRRVKKISNAHIYEAAIERQAAQTNMFDDFVRLFGGGMQPLMTHLIDTGRLTLEDVQAAEALLRERLKAGKPKP